MVNHRGIVANILDNNIEVSEFELRSLYNVLLRTLTLENIYDTPYPICLFVAASHQTGLDKSSKAWRPIKVGI